MVQTGNLIRVSDCKNRIKEGLAMRNMKQSDLVEKSGIGKSNISQYISGAFEPKYEVLIKLAAALNVNEAWLYGYNVDPE